MYLLLVYLNSFLIFIAEFFEMLVVYSGCARLDEDVPMRLYKVVDFRG
jgi:hypothetical protein